MLRRHAQLLSICRSLARDSQRSAKTLPVAWTHVRPSPLQHWGARLSTVDSACCLHTIHGLREVDVNYRYNAKLRSTLEHTIWTKSLA